MTFFKKKRLVVFQYRIVPWKNLHHKLGKTNISKRVKDILFF